MGISLKESNVSSFSNVKVGSIIISGSRDCFGEGVYIKVTDKPIEVDSNEYSFTNETDEGKFNAVCLSDGSLLYFNPTDYVCYLKEDIRISKDLFEKE